MTKRNFLSIILAAMMVFVLWPATADAASYTHSLSLNGRKAEPVTVDVDVSSMRVTYKGGTKGLFRLEGMDPNKGKAYPSIDIYKKGKNGKYQRVSTSMILVARGQQVKIHHYKSVLLKFYQPHPNNKKAYRFENGEYAVRFSIGDGNGTHTSPKGKMFYFTVGGRAVG